IVGCWASAFNPRALAYRRERGLGVEPPPVAVIVQEAVRGDVSGVLFTSNPVTGRHDEALVSACWGLGDGLVSRACGADEYPGSHDGRELSATIAGVRALSHNNARRLVAEGVRIAAELGAPQDIEWTLADGELVFLQTRPITTLSPLGAARIVWDNSN